MKEIDDIIAAYGEAQANGIRAALATVVKVEGSSYRQPGARMLVTEDGRLTGAISGGCLEGDALRKALLAIHQQQNKLITYDTSEAGNVEFGVQLGCNGIVHILFEYIDPQESRNPITLLKALQEERRETVVVTLFSTKHRHLQQGTLLVADRGNLPAVIANQAYGTALADAAAAVLESHNSTLLKFEADGRAQEALVEFRPPAIRLYIVGAGNDAKPLVDMAAVLGWETTVIDGRATHATAQRFPKAGAVKLATPDRVLDGVTADRFTAFVLMTHNYHYDLAVLQQLVTTDTRYIGSLGPKTKLQRMFDELDTVGNPLTEDQKARIYGPVGLDIGGETSDEIALAILAEIRAVLNNRPGGSLRLLQTKIHSQTPAAL